MVFLRLPHDILQPAAPDRDHHLHAASGSIPQTAPHRLGDANQGGRGIDSFLEGPSFDRQGRLYVTDIPYGRIFRVSSEGTWELVSEYDGWPNGLKIHRDGRVFITDYKRGIMLLDPASGTVTPFLETAASESFKGVNDLVFAPSGNLYFTDQGQTGMHDPTGRVWKLTPDGRLTCLVNTIPSPNGIVVDAEESFLLVAVTRANQIWRVPLPTSGLTTKVGIFSHLHGGPGALMALHWTTAAISWSVTPASGPYGGFRLWLSHSTASSPAPVSARPILPSADRSEKVFSSSKAVPGRCFAPSSKHRACRCSRTQADSSAAQAGQQRLGWVEQGLPIHDFDLRSAGIAGCEQAAALRPFGNMACPAHSVDLLGCGAMFGFVAVSPGHSATPRRQDAQVGARCRECRLPVPEAR